MMTRTLCFLLMAGLAAARPSVESSIMYVIPGNYYPYNFGLRALEGEPITNVMTPEEATRIEEIKTPEITEPILHLGGVPVETKVVEEPITEVKETETLDIETTSEILPVKETEEEVPETVDIGYIPEESLVIAEEITKAPVVVAEVVTEKDEKKTLSTIIPSLSVLVKPMSQYSQYLPSLSWLPNLSSWWPFRYGSDSRFYNRYY